MNTFKLKIITPDGSFYDSDAYQLSLKSIDGEISILAGHIPYLTAVGMGECRVYTSPGGAPMRAACCGGMLKVSKEGVLLAPTTFEWAQDIDSERAQSAKERAEAALSGNPSEADKRIATQKLARAAVRLKVAAASGKNN